MSAEPVSGANYPRIYPIRLPLPLGMGAVHAYLLRSCYGWALIDTGGSGSRKALLRGMAAAGCNPALHGAATRGMLRLIVLTHGDYDHTGNAAYLHGLTGAAIAMHPADMRMLAEGDMFAGRGQRNPLLGWLAPRLFGFGRAQRAEPNLALMDGHDLTTLGMDAGVLHLPGHSRGSIGLLTENGDLFCGDLLTNTVGGPRLNDLIDDPTAAQESLARLRALGDKVARVWPGHGEPFGLAEVP